MKPNEAVEAVVTAAVAFDERLRELGAEEPHRLEAYLKAIESGAANIRGMMLQVAEGPDDPSDPQIQAIHEVCAQLLKVAAAGINVLVEFPVGPNELPPMHLVVGRGSQGN